MQVLGFLSIVEYKITILFLMFHLVVVIKTKKKIKSKTNSIVFKKPKLALSMALFALLTSNANAYSYQSQDSDFYVSITASPTFLDKNQNLNTPKEDPEYNLAPISGSMGIVYKTKSNIRLEGEGIFGLNNKIEFDCKSGNKDQTKRKDYAAKISHIGATANAYYDIYSNDVVSGYVGGGVGLSYLNFSDIIKEDSEVSSITANSKMSIALQGKVGVSAQNVSKKFVPYFGYKFSYLPAGTVTLKIGDTSGTHDLHLVMHSLQFGALIPLQIA